MLEEELYDMDKEEENDTEVENENPEASNIPVTSSVKLYLNSINSKKLLYKLDFFYNLLYGE